MNAPIYWTLAGLLAAVTVATLAGHFIHSPDLNRRIRAWWPIILIGGAALIAGRLPILILFATLSLIALHEFLSQSRLAFLLCAVLVPIQYALTLHYLFFIPILCIPLLFFARRAAAALLICVYALSYVPMLPESLMLYLVVIAQSSDVLQYISGKLFGRHPIAPGISPHKTIEGLTGGLVTATLLGVFLRYLPPFGTARSALLSFLIALSGFLGGLLLSYIKRRRHLKDWSTLIPGHGGILDRVDSLILSAPLLYHLLHYPLHHPLH